MFKQMKLQFYDCATFPSPTMKQKHAFRAAAAVLLLLNLPASAAVVISLSNAGGGAPWSGAEAPLPSAVIDDTFAYDPNAPTSTGPIQAWNSNPGRAAFFLSAGNDADNFWTAQVSIPLGGALEFLDVWGRTDYAGSEQARHQDLIITLSDGVTTWSSTAWNGVTTSTDMPASYGRFDFSTAGVTGTLLQSATSVRIDHSAGSGQYLLLSEVRAAGAIPEPSTVLLSAVVAGLAMVRRRRA